MHRLVLAPDPDAAARLAQHLYGVQATDVEPVRTAGPEDALRWLAEARRLRPAQVGKLFLDPERRRRARERAKPPYKQEGF